MKKYSRNSRISAITKTLIENPNKLISLNSFSEDLNAAKSTISEDVLVIRKILEEFQIGTIESISGASGGIKYVAGVSREDEIIFKQNIADKLKDASRVVPGNFIYLTDMMLNPEVIFKAGKILSSKFKDLKPDYIITVETKGIPLAYEVARFMGIPLVVARKNSRVTEGTSITISYLSGTSGRMSNMGLAKKSLKGNSKCLFIDDFLRVGGTVKGISNLLKEFDSELIGIGVLVDNKEVAKNLPLKHISLVDYYGIKENGTIDMKISEDLL